MHQGAASREKQQYGFQTSPTQTGLYKHSSKRARSLKFRIKVEKVIYCLCSKHWALISFAVTAHVKKIRMQVVTVLFRICFAEWASIIQIVNVPHSVKPKLHFSASKTYGMRYCLSKYEDEMERLV